MHFQPSGGWLELICGSMFCGKTEELLRRIRRAEIARKKVQLFKPQIDNRYGLERVASHSGIAARRCHCCPNRRRDYGPFAR